jgi:glycosyltransferase involved in cell wall biosynthesis
MHIRGSHPAAQTSRAASALGVAPSIAVIVPAFNEARTIGDTLRDFHAALPDALLVVVDNNSSDGTGALARATLAALGAHGRVITEPRQGKGSAVRRAFHDTDADLYLLVDADTTYPAQQARALLQPILDGEADMVVGDRISSGHYDQQNRRPLHGIGNRMVRTLVNRIFGAALRDIMSGYRAMSRTFVRHYPLLVRGFEIETDMTMHALAHRFRIVEIPIAYRDRPAGSTSKLNTLGDGTRVLFTIVQILRYYRPLAFFGTLGLVAMCAGLLAGWPVLQDWFLYRFIYRVPLAILASALQVIALLLVSIGLVLDGLVRQYDREFELALLRNIAPPARADASASASTSPSATSDDTRIMPAGDSDASP